MKNGTFDSSYDDSLESGALSSRLGAMSIKFYLRMFQCR